VGLEEVDEGEFKVIRLKVAVMADSHNDNHNLVAALEKAGEEKVDLVIFVGDFTQVGTLENLQKAKTVLDESGLEYHVIPGDHDLWKTVGPDNFVSIFGYHYQAFEKKGVWFVLVDNSDVFSGIDNQQYVWLDNLLKTEIRKQKTDNIFIFLSTPLYHYSSPRIFGNDPKTFEEIPEVAAQREQMLALFRNTDVTALIAGDLHFSERYNDLKKIDMMNYVIGALTDTRNLQTPRFSILTIYDDESYEVEDVVL